MRGIKFRAWDKHDQKWCSWKEAVALVDTVGQMRIGIIDLSNTEESNFIFCQFTGLKDKNGKEIYEGDITNNGTVEWCENLNWDSGGSTHPGFYFKEAYEYNERGAIYENGELVR